jgi:hypothetical protein
VKGRGWSGQCRNIIGGNFRDRKRKNQGRCWIRGHEMIKENIFF